MKIKKYLNRCDMEGISGIVSYDQADPSGAEYSEGRRFFHSDLNALIRGLFDGGADEVHVYDEHFYGRNVDLSKVHQPDGKKLVFYAGKPPYRSDWAGGLTADFSGLILLGFHSMRGTGELLHHSYEPDIRALRINGVSVGEIGVEAAIAGDFGVGLAMVTADSAGIAEAEALVGAEGLTGIAVKESLSEFGGLCYPLEVTEDLIYRGALELAKRESAAKPFRCEAPVQLEVELFNTPYAEIYRRLYGEEPIVGDTALECWAEYWKRKSEVQSKL